MKRITGTVYTEGDIEKSEHGKAPENPYCLISRENDSSKPFGGDGPAPYL